ncbi:protein Shroom1 [Tachyglossus aculeatus]|uniref:protein Shroom1 n=1 Tax=Tachyglossus aculeatus TaxID=9261 RepID=UPI0018F2C2E2|nr:protein Shroom1 [Tachyglossus aculeatus]XP_038628644.1 protein Shroom1 [Tachyglossus aculeatus]XP_038628645.1 protein Shroom1 [Tachyglossus aculeatus]
MASYRHNPEGWHLRPTGGMAELLEPVASAPCAPRSSPPRSISSLDHLLQLPARADSAYSSFSGSSNVPEHPTPSLGGEHDRLPYIDSDYVRVIYNPKAACSDLGAESVDHGRPLHPAGVLGRPGINSPLGLGSQLPSPPPPPPPLPPPFPPSPPSRLDSYKALKDLDLNRRAPPLGNGTDSVDPWVPGPCPASSIEPGYSCDLWDPWQKGEGAAVMERGDWDPLLEANKKCIQQVPAWPSSFVFLEYLQSRSQPRSLPPGGAPPPTRVSQGPVGMASPQPLAPSGGTESESSSTVGHENRPRWGGNSFPDLGLGLGPQGDLPPGPHLSELAPARHSSGVSRGPSRPPSDESVPKDHDLDRRSSVASWSLQGHPEREGSRWGGRAPPPRQHMESLPDPGGASTVKLLGDGQLGGWTDLPPCPGSAEGGLGQAPLRLWRETIMGVSRPDPCPSSQPEEASKAAPGPAPQPPRGPVARGPRDRPGEKISKQGTPLLYYLSGGRVSGLLSPVEPLSKSPPQTTPSSPNPPVSAPIKIRGEGRPPPVGAELQLESGEPLLASPASSLEEGFKMDYRERLKVAQRKVLRETSFKRKDLQMSLPVRLRPKPSQRPSIEHLRSFSLSHTPREGQANPPDVALDARVQDEAAGQPQAGCGAGRKRLTKEQRKWCFSEPGKLDQVGQGAGAAGDNGRPWPGPPGEEEAAAAAVAAEARGPSLEKRGRTLSSSSLSKMELKQIQQDALMRYMVRKACQHPSGSQPPPAPLHRPPPHKRPSTASRLSEGGSAEPGGPRRSPGAEALSPTLPAAVTAPGVGLHGPVSRPTQELLRKAQPLVGRMAEGGPTTQWPSAEELLGPDTLASGMARERARSIPSAQVSLRGAAPSGWAGWSRTLSFPADSRGRPPCGGDGAATEEPGTSEMAHQSSELLPLARCRCSPLPFAPSMGRKTAMETPYSQLPAPHTVPWGQENPEPPRGSDGAETVVPMSTRLPCTKAGDVSFSSQSTCLGAGPTPASEWPVPSPPGPLLLSSPSSPGPDDVFLRDSPPGQSRPSGDASCPWAPYVATLPASAPTPQSPPGASGEKPGTVEPQTSFSGPEGTESKLRAERRREALKEDDPCSAAPAVLCQASPLEGSQKKERETETQAPAHQPTGRSPQHWRAELSQEQVAESPSRCPAQPNRDKNTSLPALPPGPAARASPGLEPRGESPTLGLQEPRNQRYQELALEIIAEDQSLTDILSPYPARKTALDLMEGLFPDSFTALGRGDRKQRARLGQEFLATTGGEQSPDSPATVMVPDAEQDPAPEADPAPSDPQRFQPPSKGAAAYPDGITAKKVELAGLLQDKLHGLREERRSALAAATACARWGTELDELVRHTCKPNEHERYAQFIGDLEKVVSLLLCLSSRLARVQNALSRVDDSTDAEERQSLNDRLSLLSRQREDAKDLKENLDRRERVVCGILSKQLPPAQLQDYRDFVRTKASLLMEQKGLDEQIMFCEEQLESLQSSIPL